MPAARSMGFRSLKTRSDQIDFPGATFSEAIGINSEGEITGVYSLVTHVETANDNHGFVLKDGEFVSFDFADAATTFAWKINDQRQIVGCWTDTNGVVRGFLRNRGGGFATVEFPGTTYSYASAINESGAIVGTYLDAGGTTHGYLATKTRPDANSHEEDLRFRALGE